MIDTKEKILDTAERLFSEKGYDAVSLRHIIGEAGVNLAAVHYHFGSKPELLDEVVRRRVAPVNEDRLTLLERAESESGPEGPSLESILEAFFLPLAEKAEKFPQFVRLMGRVHAEGLLPQIAGSHFERVIKRFVAALRRALPALAEDEFMWRCNFLIGSMVPAMIGPLSFLPACPHSDFRDRIAVLIAYICGGMRAPAMIIQQKRIIK